MTLFTRTSCFVALALITAAASAQYVGPGTAAAVRTPTTIAELMKNPVDGQGVQLRGRLLQQLNYNKYIFSDGKSQVRVQINLEVFPKQAVDDTTLLEITGKVEKDFLETPEIDATSAVVIDQPPPSTGKR